MAKGREPFAIFVVENINYSYPVEKARKLEYPNFYRGKLMRDDMIDRILEEAYFIAETGATVRSTAKLFSLGKSTVHKDVTERLKKIDTELYHRVKKVLSVNLAERHIRGGEATKQKYLKQSEE